jgi:hypothetical protein
LNRKHLRSGGEPGESAEQDRQESHRSIPTEVLSDAGDGQQSDQDHLPNQKPAAGGWLLASICGAGCKDP